MAINNQINNSAATATQVQEDAFNIGVDSGAANAYVVTVNPAPAALFDGLTVQFTPLNNNTLFNPTLNLNGLGAVQIYNPGFQGLYAGDINTNGQQAIVQCIPDGIGGFYWMLLNPQQFFANTKSIAGNNYQFGSDSGIANAYNFVPNSGFTGVSVQFGTRITDIPPAGLTNTNASCTMAYNGNFSSTVRLEQDAALVANDIVANNSRPYDFEYGRTASGLLGWILKNPATGKLTINVQTLTASSGTYTPTPGTQHIEVEMVGGGGGSGGVSAAAGVSAVSCGGGSGAYAKFTMTKTQIGASLAYTVGAAGTAGTTTPSAGGAGGSSTFGTWTCPGGNGSSPVSSQSSFNGATSSVITVGTGQLIATMNTRSGTATSATLGSNFFCTWSPGGGNPISWGNHGAMRAFSAATAGSGSNTLSADALVGTCYGVGGGGVGRCSQASGSTVTGAGNAGTAGVIIVKEYIYR